MKARVWAWFGAVFSAMVLSASAQPTILSAVPANGASGVSTSVNVKFTFSTVMDTNATTATFFNPSFSQVPASSVWSVGNTVLTCSPSPSWPSNVTITWIVNGQDTNGNALGGVPVGTFTTAGGAGSGNGTNVTTTFVVERINFYDQTSTNAPVPDPIAPFNFASFVGLASNRTASAVNLTLPTAVATNLSPTSGHPESFTLFANGTNQSALDAAFPSGTYTFVLQPSNSLTASVVLPASLTQPAAPRVSNFPATQSVNATNSFQLTWDAFPGGTGTDFVSVAVGTNFQTTSPGLPGALPGTATSVTIPANTLAPNSNYSASVTFVRGIVYTNNTNFIGFAERGAFTQFTLLTGSGTASNTIVLTNWAITNGLFSFDVKTGTNLTVRVDYNTNLSTTNWATLITTNSGTGVVRVTDPQTVSNHTRYYRGHLGP